MSIYSGDIRRFLYWLQWTQQFSDYVPGFIPPALTNTNYVPPDRDNTVLITAAVLVAVSTLVSIARLMARRFREFRKFRTDDLLLLPALVLTIGFSVVQILDSKRGCIGQHAYDCSLTRIKYSYTLKYASNLIYIFAAFHIKATVIALLLQLCPRRRSFVRTCIYTVGAFIFLSFIISLFMNIFYCKQAVAGYRLDIAISENIAGKRCYPIYSWNYGWAILYAIADFALLILAGVLLPHVENPHKQVLGIAAVFGSALFASIASIVRATYVRPAWNSYDQTWTFIPLILWSLLELHFGLIAIALPPMNILILDYKIPGISHLSAMLESISSPPPQMALLETDDDRRGRVRQPRPLVERRPPSIIEYEEPAPQMIREVRLQRRSDVVPPPRRVMRAPRRTEDSDSGSDPQQWRQTRLQHLEEEAAAARIRSQLGIPQPREEYYFTPGGSFYEVIVHSREGTVISEQPSDMLVIQRPLSPSVLSYETDESVWGLPTSQFR